MEAHSTCRNCGSIVFDCYCGRCGQKAAIKRWKLSRISRSALSSIFDLEKGFGYTFKSLLLYPGKMIQEYLNGRTVVYTNPFRYLIFTSLISVILSKWIEKENQDDWEEVFRPFRETNMLPSDEAAVRLQELIHNTLGSDYGQLSLLIYVPFFALFVKLFFRRTSYNYSEYLIASAFLLGQYYLYDLLIEVTIRFIPVLYDWRLWIDTLFVALLFGQTFHILTQQSKRRSYIKVFLAYGFALLLIVILFFLGLVLFGYLQMPTF
jgi:hypothetical protein